MPPDGARWFKMALDDPRCPQMAPHAPRWAPNGTRCPLMATDGPRWLQMAPDAPRWPQIPPGDPTDGPKPGPFGTAREPKYIQKHDGFDYFGASSRPKIPDIWHRPGRQKTCTNTTVLTTLGRPPQDMPPDLPQKRTSVSNLSIAVCASLMRPKDRPCSRFSSYVLRRSRGHLAQECCFSRAGMSTLLE